ncbi:MAG: hypothetical protein ACI87E_003429 [Mariniblastus sp.]
MDVAPPYIDLNGPDKKSGQGNDIPMRSDLSGELQAGVADMESQPAEILKLPVDSGSSNSDYSNPAISEKLWFAVPSGLVRILNRNLKVAKIPDSDERGKTDDVHGPRHSFGTLLATSGAALRGARGAF